MKDEIATAKESIKVLQAMLSTGQWDPVRAELEFAIRQCQKRIPVKPIHERWQPNRCPACGADLGGECNDGYYENPFLEFCPDCGQAFDYGS